LNLIEIDYRRKLSATKKKIDLYREIMPNLQMPKLYFFTHTEDRKRKLEGWLKGIRSEVMMFKEIL